MGPYPLERLPRLNNPAAAPVRRGGKRPVEPRSGGPHNASHAYQTYFDIYDAQRTGDVSELGPVPSDLTERANHIKGGLYFLNADMAGCGIVPQDAWVDEAIDGQDHSVVVIVGHTRIVGVDQPGDEWINGTRQVNADLRAAELAAVTATYIRRLGFAATAHTPTATDVDLDQLALQCGLIESVRGELRAPFLAGGFSVAAVTTEFAMTPDAPLAPRSLVSSLRSTKSPEWFLGVGGTRAGIGRFNGDHRPLHMGRYPMERIDRVPEATTLIIPKEVKRVPVRAGGFPRAAHGDMGPKFKKDVGIFSYKTPSAQAYIQQIGAMVPYQDGDVAGEVAPGTSDAGRNADAVKALAYHLGGDMVGVCEVPEYAWYSHNGKGEEITPHHKYGVVILLDQGYETMEGASGDDWISGAQSMRAYMRGAQIAGIMAEHLRLLGYSARSHTNKDSEVLHIPLVLEAGLGEMSRIGELVLNPFVGPRFKSVVLTTDMELTPDLKIDFGLQDFCSKCTKCARECPCGAIPFGDKIMFNGYETWKPDVEKCTKYRLGNLKGSACGRCMKTCPYNVEGVLSERPFLWAAIKLPFARKFIADLDDKVGNGSINPIKKWWWDLEFVEGKTVHPTKGTNARDLDMDGGRIADKQKIAIYPPDVLPAGDNQGVPVKLMRKEAIVRGEQAETPAAARARLNT